MNRGQLKNEAKTALISAKYEQVSIRLKTFYDTSSVDLQFVNGGFFHHHSIWPRHFKS